MNITNSVGPKIIFFVHIFCTYLLLQYLLFLYKSYSICMRLHSPGVVHKVCKQKHNFLQLYPCTEELQLTTFYSLY